MGTGSWLGGRRPDGDLVHAYLSRRDGWLPPLLHAWLVQGQARHACRPRDCREHVRAGPGPALGGRPPPAPRVLRQGGRPALAVAVRHLAGRTGPRLLARTHGVGPRTRPDQPGAVRARPAG